MSGQDDGSVTSARDEQDQGDELGKLGELGEEMSAADSRALGAPAPAIAAIAPTPLAASRGETVMFLESPAPSAPLAETTNYRPGALVALVFLAPPIVSALVFAALAPMLGAPVWLPLCLLLWIPALAAGWWALGGVRLTRETIAFGRPLRPWRVVALDTVQRLERHGPRLTLVTSAGRISFVPALLGRGAQLRRRLLLTLPVNALGRETRAEVQRLLEGRLARAFAGRDSTTGQLAAIAPGASPAPSATDGPGAADALSLSTPGWWAGAASALALVCALGAGAILLWAPAPLVWLALTPGALALLALGACLWLAQEIFLSDRGVIARYTLTGVTGAVAWSDVRGIRRAPGEVALILRGPRPLICAGPALMPPAAARRMREAVSRFAIDRGTPVTGRPRR
jgi:hypothetical protein